MVQHDSLRLHRDDRLFQKAKGLVDVVGGDLVDHVDLGKGFRESDQRLELADCDPIGRFGPAHDVVLPQPAVAPDKFRVGLARDLRRALARGQDVRRQLAGRERRVEHALGTSVDVDDVRRDRAVGELVAIIDDDEKQIEAGHDGGGHVDVGLERLGLVVAAVLRVGGGQNCRPRVEVGVDTRLCDGNRLLLHGLVDGRPVLLVHLVKLVDAAEAVVCEDERAALERPLLGERVLVDARREADGRGAFARRVDGARHDAAAILEQLRLCAPGVAEEEHVDVAADAVLPVDVLRAAAEHGQRERALDVLLTVDGRRDGGDDALDDLGVPGEADDLALVVLADGARRGLARGALGDVVRLNIRREDGKPGAAGESRVVGVRVDARDLDLFAGLHGVDEVREQNHVLVPRHAARRHRAWRLLDDELLVVAVDGLLLVELERPVLLACRARCRLDLGGAALLERPEERRAAHARELDELELREDARAPRHHAAHADELVQVALPQVAQVVQDGEVADAHVHLVLDRRVGREQLGRQHQLVCDLVEDLEDIARRVGDPDGQDGYGGAERGERDFEAGEVVGAHLRDGL
mmetsp:Transcript_9781/g.34429  ORF Transcript_9781/g.34429 Transcript_9781/m.34429 type:complete len:583 (-) Transcript_9781:609-2357(-)